MEQQTGFFDSLLSFGEGLWESATPYLNKAADVWAQKELGSDDQQNLQPQQQTGQNQATNQQNSTTATGAFGLTQREMLIGGGALAFVALLLLVRR